MPPPGQTLENPVTGERFTFIDTAASSGGERLAFGVALRPGGAVPIAHVHPVQTERFQVVSGRMRFRLGLRTLVADAGGDLHGTPRSTLALANAAEAGDVVEVAPGTMHAFANAGEEEARVLVEVRPALAMESMFAEVVAMAR